MSGSNVSRRVTIIEERRASRRRNPILRELGRQVRPAVLCTEGSFTKSTPGANRADNPAGHDPITRALPDNVSLAKRSAIFVFLLKCPSPAASAGPYSRIEGPASVEPRSPSQVPIGWSAFTLEVWSGIGRVSPVDQPSLRRQ